MISDIQQVIGSVATKEDLFALVETMNYPVVVTTYNFKDPVILYANKMHEKLTGYGLDAIRGKNPRMFQGLATNKQVIRDLKDGLLKYDSWDGYFINYDRWSAPLCLRIVIMGISIPTGEKFYIAVKKLR